MVVFTCNNCGESLQKPRVDKHYQTICRNSKNLTCVDCFKDFRGEEYVSHIKCLTEEERYAAKGSLPNGIIKKGEVKQQSWTDMIIGIIEKETNLSLPLKNILNIVAGYVNIPRKKAKFMNFVSNSFGRNYSAHHVEEIWNLIEKHKAENFPKKEDKPTITPEPVKRKVDENEAPELDIRAKKPKSKKLKSKIDENNVNAHNVDASKEMEFDGSNNTESGNDDSLEKTEISTKKEKRKKNRNSSNFEIKEGMESTVKNKIENKKKGISCETKNHENGRESNNPKIIGIDKNDPENPFSFEDKILEILNRKKQLSFKKLEKKVLRAYIKHRQIEEYTDKHVKKFNKRVKKLPQIEIKDDYVVLL